MEDYFSLLWPPVFQVGRQTWSGWWLLYHCLQVPCKVSLIPATRAIRGRGQEGWGKAQPRSSTNHSHLLSGRWSHMTMMPGRLGNMVEPTSTCHSTILPLQKRGSSQGLLPQKAAILTFYRGGNWGTEQWRNSSESTDNQCGAGVHTWVVWLLVHAFNHYAVLDFYYNISFNNTDLQIWPLNILLP